MDKIEYIKQEIEIIKQKLLLFATGFGGSSVLIIKQNPDFYFKVILYIISSYTAIGIMSNLKELNKLLKEIRNLKEKL